MLYFIHGSNMEKSGEQARKLVAALRMKKPDAVYMRFDHDTFDDAQFEAFIGSRGLFEPVCIVYGDQVFMNASAKEFVFERLHALASSENIFLFREGIVGREVRDAMEAQAEKTHEYATAKTSEKKYTEEFNIFSLADALGRRDRKGLWVLYRRALLENLSPEEIHSTFFWQAKNMLLAKSARSAEETALKPFVYGKSKRFSTNYTPAELTTLSSRLVAAYHQARAGGPELEISLEQFILGI